MTGFALLLGVVAGVAIGVVITALRWVIVRRFDPPTIPPSAEVLEAERTNSNQRPLTNRRTR